MKSKITTAAEVLGMGFIAIGGFLVAAPLGFILSGVALIATGVLVGN